MSNSQASRLSVLEPTQRPLTQTASTLSAPPTWSTTRRPRHARGTPERGAVHAGGVGVGVPAAVARGRASGCSCSAAGPSPGRSSSQGPRSRAHPRSSVPAATSASVTSSGRSASRNRHTPSRDRNHGDAARLARAPPSSGNGTRGARMGSRPTADVLGLLPQARLDERSDGHGGLYADQDWPGSEGVTRAPVPSEEPATIHECAVVEHRLAAVAHHPDVRRAVADVEGDASGVGQVGARAVQRHAREGDGLARTELDRHRVAVGGRLSQHRVRPRPSRARSARRGASPGTT